MIVRIVLDLVALTAWVALLAAALGPEEPPKNSILRGVRDIFNAMEGRPLPTPGNAIVWWRRRRARRVIRAGQAK